MKWLAQDHTTGKGKTKIQAQGRLVLSLLLPTMQWCLRAVNLGDREDHSQAHGSKGGHRESSGVKKENVIRDAVGCLN